MPKTIKFRVEPTQGKKDWSDYLSQKEGRTISVDELKKIPYNSIGKLLIYEGNGVHQFGSAFKVAPNILMTAAHCLANIVEDRAYYFKDVVYCPVFPHREHYTAIQLAIPDTYIKGKHTQHDYGFVIFDRELPGDILQLEVEPATSGMCCSVGYPDSFKYFGDKMVEAKGYYSKPYQEQMIVMSSIDMRSGCSGGPIIDDISSKVISLNSGNIGKHSDRQMSGPMMRIEILMALEKLTEELNLPAV